MATFASFMGAHGTAPEKVVQQITGALDATVGDCLLMGKIGRAQIRARTLSGVDVNGAPFAAYSTKGPYYFYPNGDVGSTRGGSAAVKQARATAAKGRFNKLGGGRGTGVRTPYGIRYDSYAAAKSAHGSGVNLFGMEQHPHMLDGIIVRAGGAQSDAAGPPANTDAFDQATKAGEFFIGIYDDRAGRARGHNEGAGHLPKREFFALNAADYALMRQVLIERINARANAPGR